MSKPSRRLLARYAVNQLLAGKSARRIAKELAAVIIESKRTLEPEFLVGDIAWELERRKELAVGNVISARALDDKVRTELEQQIKKAIGVKEVLLNEMQDEQLIGGVRIETASRVWDFSVARKLSQLREPG